MALETPIVKWLFQYGVGKQKTNPGFGKYGVSLQYTQRTSGAALEDDFSYNNNRCFVK